MAMNRGTLSEVHRLAYLGAMEVPSYLPTRRLAGAKPSELCDWPKDQPVYASVTVNPSPVPPAVDQKAVLSRLQQELTPPSKSARSSRPEVLPVQTGARPRTPDGAKSSSNPVQFQLAMFQPRQDLLVLLPVHHMERSHMQLFRNILLALGISHPEMVPIENFRWPPAIPLGTRGLDDLTVASQTLQAMLEALRQQKSIRHIFFFDSDWSSQLFPAEVSAALSILVLPSLSDMLETADLKKQCWQQIRHLKA